MLSGTISGLMPISRLVSNLLMLRIVWFRERLVRRLGSFKALLLS